MGRHGNDRHVCARLLFSLPDHGDDSQAVYLRHLHIHQRQVKLLLFQCGKRLTTITHYRDSVTALLQEANQNFLVGGVVLGKQDARALSMFR